MIDKKKEKIALITGSAGFIGYHLSNKLLQNGWRVIGLDCMSDYYDISLKQDREKILLKSDNYRSVRANVEDFKTLLKILDKERPTLIVHLAAQAGVRYSIENPRAYLKSNVIGTFELLEAARNYPPKHMLIASTSSAYGSNKKMPYKEIDKSDHQMSFYAATKKATENFAHSYSHLFNIPITMFRFFTVYGPWGRPDMALFKFTKAILNGEKIDVYNYGNMKRDFTYIDDLIEGIFKLIKCLPESATVKSNKIFKIDSKSDVAPFRLVNIGNSNPVELKYFINAIENSTKKKAILNLMPIQSGDIPETHADTSLLQLLINYLPKTDINTGVEKFVSWYRDYYQI